MWTRLMRRLMRWLMSTMRRCIHRRCSLSYRSKCIVGIGRCDCRIHGSPWHWHICRSNRFIEESIRYGNNYAKKFQWVITAKWWEKENIRIKFNKFTFFNKNRKKSQIFSFETRRYLHWRFYWRCLIRTEYTKRKEYGKNATTEKMKEMHKLDRIQYWSGSTLVIPIKTIKKSKKISNLIKIDDVNCVRIVRMVPKPRKYGQWFSM